MYAEGRLWESRYKDQDQTLKDRNEEITKLGDLQQRMIQELRLWQEKATLAESELRHS